MMEKEQAEAVAEAASTVEELRAALRSHAKGDASHAARVLARACGGLGASSGRVAGDEGALCGVAAACLERVRAASGARSKLFRTCARRCVASACDARAGQQRAEAWYAQAQNEAAPSSTVALAVAAAALAPATEAKARAVELVVERVLRERDAHVAELARARAAFSLFWGDRGLRTFFSSIFKTESV